MTESECSYLRCCSDIESNNDTSTTCDSTLRSATSYNPLKGITESLLISCIDQYSECFRLNQAVSAGQCCECETGWLGHDCSIPTCLPECVHGKCISPNKCQCNQGWTGQHCDIAICSSCVNGICHKPEECVCTEGWEGNSCEIATSVPACVNGKAVLPNVCECDKGYSGKICDIATCNDIKCIHGWCVNPNVCECKPGYYTDDLTSVVHCNYSNCKETYGLLCIECTQEECKKCIRGYYLKESQCKSEEYIKIEIIRYGGYYGDVSVKYATLPLDARNNLYSIDNSDDVFIDYADISGVVNLPHGESYAYIEIPIFPDLTCTSRSKQFQLFLYNPTGGSILSPIQSVPLSSSILLSELEDCYSYATLEIYDDITIPDIISTSVVFPVSISGVNTLYTKDPIDITIQAYIDSTTAYNTGGHLFISDVRRYQDNTRFTPYDLCYVENHDFGEESEHYGTYEFIDQNNGRYVVSLDINHRGRYVAEFYCLSSGVEVFVWNNNLLSGNTVYHYISYSLGNFSPVLYKPNLVFSARFVGKYMTSRDITYSLYVDQNEEDSIQVFINDMNVLDCLGQCSSSDPVEILAGVYYDIRVDYIHRSQKTPYFDIIQSNGLRYNPSDLYVKGNLQSSIQFYMLASYNSISTAHTLLAIYQNNQWQYNDLTLQAGQDYNLRVVLRDEYSNIILPSSQYSYNLTIKTASSSYIHSINIDPVSGCYGDVINLTEAGITYVKLDQNYGITVDVQAVETEGSRSEIKKEGVCKVYKKCIVKIMLKDRYGNTTKIYRKEALEVYYLNTERELIEVIDADVPYVEIYKENTQTGWLEAYYDMTAFSNNKLTLIIQL